MNVQKATKLVTMATEFVKQTAVKFDKLPGLAKLGIAAAGTTCVFGAGVATSMAVIGDKFEKINARLDALEQSNPNNENVKTAETLALKKEVETKKENQVKLIKPEDYILPEISENGRIDTSYYDGTRRPRFISYKDKPAGNNEGELRTVREEAYENDGKMMHYRVFDWSYVPTSGCYTGKPSTTTYDFDGNILDKDRYYNYGRIETHYFNRSSGVSDEMTYEYDEKGYTKSFRKTDYGNEFYSQYSTFNPDGSVTLELRGDNKKEIQKKDKNGKILERKRIGKNGILQYTITPQYDKDGTLIKNDTVWNK